MTKAEIATFIERMEDIGDVWTEEQVQDVYGDKTLQEALDDRQASINAFGDIVNTVING